MYLLFAYDRYYPEGASSDFVCKYSTMEECLDKVKLNDVFDCLDIYDVEDDEWYTFKYPLNENVFYYC